MTINIPNFANTRVLVIGDLMLDRYWHGITQRISPEAPVPVVQIKQMEDRPGGAGNVALNIAALGGQVTLIGICGTDENANIMENKLRAANIDCHLIRLASKPTITKLRILSLHQQLIRLDFEENFYEFNNQALLDLVSQHLEQTSAIVLSDYGKGTLKQSLSMIQLGQKHNIPVLVDPKSKDFSIYQGATVLKPNRKELEEVIGVCHSESQIISGGQKLIEQYALQNLLITRGAEGMTLLRPGKLAYHLPAITHEVYDVTGAGDTVIAVLALALGTGCDLEFSTLLANRAAGIVVGKLGAATVSLPEIRRAIQNDQSTNSGVVEQEQLLITVFDAKAHGERIVMTNGCFDILHAGHVAYLEQAKSHGDRLIVAVNDDASVARLKGTGRPINKLEHRMAVLAALSSVDWVVPFSEDTPERLICEVLPDILVKGGDYLPENIAGNQCVVANGGKVLILNFVPGCSTTSMITRAETLRVEKRKQKKEEIDL